jgi:hypothetical protein
MRHFSTLRAWASLLDITIASIKPAHDYLVLGGPSVLHILQQPSELLDIFMLLSFFKHPTLVE